MPHNKNYDSFRSKSRCDCKSCKRKEKCCSINPCEPINLKLTSVINNPNEYEEFEVQISPDGSLAYTCNIQLAAPFYNAQTLYANNNGVLTQISAITVAEIQSVYPNYVISSGAASPDFTLFALVLIPPITAEPSAGLGIIQFYNLVNRQFNLINTFSFTDLLANYPFCNVSKLAFTPDNRYFVFNYSQYTTTASSSAITVPGIMTVIDLSTSPPTVTSKISTQSYSPGGSFFSLSECNRGCTSERLYLINSTTVFSGTNYLELTSTAAQITFYSFRKGILTQIGTPIPQPQFIITLSAPFTIKPEKSIKILIGTELALLPGEVTTTDITQTVPPNNNFTFIPGDNRNFRIYEFDGKNAELIYAKHFDTGVLAGDWYPNGKEFALVLGAGFTNLQNISCSTSSVPTTAPNVIQLFTLDKNIVNPASSAIVAPASAIIQFSENGKWLMVGGGGQGTSSNVITTNLYSISKNKIDF